MRVRLVHGFAQAPRIWEPVEAHLPRDWDVQAIAVPDGLDFVATAETLGMRGAQGTWVGYSMGGRLVLRLALERPDLVDRLVLISASAGVASPHEREQRRAEDENWAQQVEHVGVATFLERWHDQRLFESLPRSAAMLEVRARANSVQGVAHQLRVLGQGAQDPLWDRLGELEMPVLVVSGAWDRGYVELAERMGAAINGAEVVTVPSAGHSVPLERPAELAGVLADWLSSAADEGERA